MEVYRNISKHYGHPYNKTYYYYYGLASTYSSYHWGEREWKWHRIIIILIQNKNNNTVIIPLSLAHYNDYSLLYCNG